MRLNLNTCLITGLPGSGKTLLAVEMLLENSKLENPRPVYTNIKGLCSSLGANSLPDNLDEIYVDTTHGENSHPQGSVFIIDEAQSLGYAPLANGSKRPQKIKILETRRHNGYDFIIITQHPKLIDKNVRVLLADHYHAVRPFGAKMRSISHWQTVNENPEPLQNASNAIVTKKLFDKELFKLYRSATVHTQKFNFPKKPFFVISFAIIFILVAFFVTKKSLASQITSYDSTIPASSHNAIDLINAQYSGFSLHLRRGMAQLDLFFNIDDQTYNLNDFSYAIDGYTVTVYRESGYPFAVFDIEDSRPLPYL